MSEWFDRSTGKLVVGEAAYQERLELAFPSDMVPLADMLLHNEPLNASEGLVAKGQRFPRLSNEDIVQYGAWLLRVMRSADPQAGLMIEHFDRGFAMGLGPSKQTILRRLGSIYALRERIDAPHFLPDGTFEQWSTDEFVQNAAQLSASLGGRKPSEIDYREWARQGKGPGVFLIKQTFKGGLSSLNERIGFPNVKRFEEEDFYDWGVRFMRANDGRAVGAPELDVLSAKGCAPSVATVYTHMGALSRYGNEVARRYENDQADREYHAEVLMKSFEQLDLSGYPEVSGWTNNEKIAYIARHELAVACLPRAEPEQLHKLASQKTNALVRSLCRADSRLTPGHIETVAVTLDVFDDIWEMYPYDRQKFRVDPGEVERARQLRNSRRRRPTTG